MRPAFADRCELSWLRLHPCRRLLRDDITGFLHRSDDLECQEMLRIRYRLRGCHQGSILGGVAVRIEQWRMPRKVHRRSSPASARSFRMDFADTDRPDA